MRSKDYFDRLALVLDKQAQNELAPWARWAWDTVASEIGPARGGLIVDLGTGTGTAIEAMLRFTRGARFLGVDFAGEMIRRAREKDLGREQGVAVDFLEERIDRLCLPARSVDVFVSWETFRYIPNKRRVLAQLFGMLRPGGKLVNVDQFQPTARTRAETERLRQRCAREAAEHDRARRASPRVVHKDQRPPRESNTDPYEFRRLLRSAGFTEAAVYLSLQPGFAVVTGQRPCACLAGRRRASK